MHSEKGKYLDMQQIASGQCLSLAMGQDLELCRIGGDGVSAGQLTFFCCTEETGEMLGMKEMSRSFPHTLTTVSQLMTGGIVKGRRDDDHLHTVSQKFERKQK